MSRHSLYKSPDDLRGLIAPGELTRKSLEVVRELIQPGISTIELDRAANHVIVASGGRSNFQMVPGYHHTVCVSVNDEVVHGIPGDRVLRAGDIVSVDSGAEFGGWNGDSAITVVIPGGDPAEHTRRERLSSVTQGALWAGVACLAEARHLNEVGGAIEDFVDAAAAEDGNTYGILTDYIGHGIGRSMHEEPPVFNYRVRGRGPAVKPGLVVAIEPMVTLGGIDTFVADDEWTVITADHSMASHWEHSVAVHQDGIWVLTAEDGGAAGLAPWGITPTPIP